MSKIENLVFKGGGVLGVAYAGAVQTLEDHDLLKDIKGVAGTSAGAIVATLLCLRYPSSNIKDIVSMTNFKGFEDRCNPIRIFTKYGLYKGDFLLSWIKKIIKDKTNNENITFSEMGKRGYRNLKVFATDLNSKNVKEFSQSSTPDVIVAESIRASMSIPLFFSAWKFPKNNPDDHVYVDGGTVYNYPITAFVDLKKTLGFFLYNKKKKDVELKYNHLSEYIKVLFHTLMTAQDIDFDEDTPENRITVKIDDFGIPPTDFSINPEEEDNLYKSGMQCTVDYLKNQNII